MFVGHLAVGLAGKRFATRTSLGTLFVAAQLPDVLWSLLLLTGVEHARIVPGITAASPLDLYDFPISHSLLMDVVWGALFALGNWLVRRYTRGACVLGLAVVSHWVLDWLSHRPDMPLAPRLMGRYGAGVWNSIPLTLVVEGGIWLLGLVIYLRATKPRDRLGSYGFWPAIVLLTGIWIASVGGPPPPNIRVVALGNIASLAVFAWAYWIDTHRPAVAARPPSQAIISSRSRPSSARSMGTSE